MGLIINVSNTQKDYRNYFVYDRWKLIKFEAIINLWFGLGMIAAI